MYVCSGQRQEIPFCQITWNPFKVIRHGSWAELRLEFGPRAELPAESTTASINDITTDVGHLMSKVVPAVLGGAGGGGGHWSSQTSVEVNPALPPLSGEVQPRLVGLFSECLHQWSGVTVTSPVHLVSSLRAAAAEGGGNFVGTLLDR